MLVDLAAGGRVCAGGGQKVWVTVHEDWVTVAVTVTVTGAGGGGGIPVGWTVAVDLPGQSEREAAQLVTVTSTVLVTATVFWATTEVTAARADTRANEVRILADGKI